jgi:hypothetical protein
MYRLAMMDSHGSRPVDIRISRGTAFDDSVAILNGPAGDLRLEIQSARFNLEEAYGQGTIREWFTVVTQDMFNPMNGLFQLREDYEPHYSEVSPTEFHPPLYREYYKAVGRFMALSITQRNPIGVTFPIMFYAKMMGRSLSIEDISQDEPNTFRTLNLIQNCETEEDLSGLGMDVTLDNRDAFISERLDSLIAPEAFPFIQIIGEGFNDVIPMNLVNELFTPRELAQMIVGASEISVEDFTRNVSLVGYSHASPQIQWLIGLLDDFTPEQKNKFLRFATGTTQLPPGGFANLPQPFCIARQVDDLDDLPTAATCFYTMRLPEYKDEEILRKKVTMAIEADYGMGLE